MVSRYQNLLSKSRWQLCVAINNANPIYQLTIYHICWSNMCQHDIVKAARQKLPAKHPRSPRLHTLDLRHTISPPIAAAPVPQDLDASAKPNVPVLTRPALHSMPNYSVPLPLPTNFQDFPPGNARKGARRPGSIHCQIQVNSKYLRVLSSC